MGGQPSDHTDETEAYLKLFGAAWDEIDEEEEEEEYEWDDGDDDA